MTINIQINQYPVNEIINAQQTTALPGSLPFLRYAFQRNVLNGASFHGAGLYACFYKDRLIYLGKYLGQKNNWQRGDIISLRWVKHIGSFTMLARQLGFSQHAINEITAYLEAQNPISLNGAGTFLQQFHNADNEILKKDKGYMSTFSRFKVALEVWHENGFLLEPKLKDFKFVYAKIAAGQNLSTPVVRELVSSAENSVLNVVQPAANTINNRTQHESNGLWNIEKTGQLLKGKLLEAAGCIEANQPEAEHSIQVVSSEEPEESYGS